MIVRRKNLSIPINDIKEKFDKVIQYSQYGIETPNTENLFKNWSSNKEYFYYLFGNQCIWEYPEKVSFELDDNTKQARVTDLIAYILCNKYSTELADFIDQQKKGFFDNKVVEEYVTELNEIITKDTKLIKAFKYFIKDKEVLNDLQSRASRIIQENKVEGKLCFSIHPLDYLSISETTHNWRSCHALDGEYRAGNLSYMMDNCTVICYLKSEQDTKLPHFPDDVPWNSKKWRVLLYFDPHMSMCFAGRQYPFASNKGMEWIINHCFNYLFTENYKNGFHLYRWSNWTDYMINSAFDKKNNAEMNFYNYIPFRDGLTLLTDVVKNAAGSRQFNDILSSSHYKPIYAYLTKPSAWNKNFDYLIPNKDTKITVGHPTYCLRCGDNEIMDEGSTMMCYDCEYQFGNSNNDVFCVCDCCGNRMLTDDGYFSSDDKLYCPHCWEKYVEQCVCCGDQLEKDDMKYDDEFEEWYCEECWRGRH